MIRRPTRRGKTTGASRACPFVQINTCKARSRAAVASRLKETRRFLTTCRSGPSRRSAKRLSRRTSPERSIAATAIRLESKAARAPSMRAAKGVRQRRGAAETARQVREPSELFRQERPLRDCALKTEAPGVFALAHLHAGEPFQAMAAEEVLVVRTSGHVVRCGEVEFGRNAASQDCRNGLNPFV